MTVWHRMSTVVPSTTNYNWQHWCLDACQFSDIQHVLCSSFVDNKFTRSFLTTSHLGSSSLTTTCPSWASLSQPVLLTWACPFQCVKWGNRGPTRPNETLPDPSNMLVFLLNWCSMVPLALPSDVTHLPWNIWIVSLNPGQSPGSHSQPNPCYRWLPVLLWFTGEKLYRQLFLSCSMSNVITDTQRTL